MLRIRHGVSDLPLPDPLPELHNKSPLPLPPSHPCLPVSMVEKILPRFCPQVDASRREVLRTSCWG